MKFCGTCGTPLEVDAVFCGSCGARVVPLATPEPVDLGALVTGPPPTAPVPPTPPAPPAPPAPPTAPAPPPPPVPPAAPPPPAPNPQAAPPTILAPATTLAPVSATEPMLDPPGSRRAGTMVVLGLLAVAAIAAGVFLLVTRGDDAATGAAPGATATSTTTAAGGDGDGVAPGDTTADGDAPGNSQPAPTEPAPAPTAAPTTLSPEAAATAALAAHLSADQATADGLQNTFVPQLSAKKVGLEIDGVTYGPEEILADHEALRAAHNAILVDAGRYQFQHQGGPMTGWYLTIIPISFPTKDAATQWCTDHGLGPDACFGRTFQPLA